MTGELAEPVALTAHGNAFLARGTDATDLAGTTAFRYVSSIALDDGLTRITNTSSRFGGLRERGAASLALAAGPIDRRLAVFSNAGRWWIDVLATRGDEPWRGEWSVTDQAAEDRRIWSVVYRTFEPEPVEGPELVETRTRLGRALADAAAFSVAQRQALAAATRARVFGGMGSWNDLVFDHGAVESEYDEISTRLFEAVLDAIVAATNAFDGSAK